MNRAEFIRKCSIGGLAVATSGLALSSCESLYYASHKREKNLLTVAKSEFQYKKKDKIKNRSYVVIENTPAAPICLYKVDGDKYVACLMECTHQNCELNIAAGAYNCPCHGSEFSMTGIVLEGPADKNLKTFITKNDTENVYITLS